LSDSTLENLSGYGHLLHEEAAGMAVNICLTHLRLV
jgi:hypothetical protein